MTLKKPKPGVERRLTSGNLWTIAVMVAGIISGTGINHFVPSKAAQDAADASSLASAKAEEAAKKAAVMENVVATHTSEIQMIATSVDELKMSVAVLKSQGDTAKTAAQSNSEKLDRLLQAVYRMQGATTGPLAPARPNQ